MKNKAPNLSEFPPISLDLERAQVILKVREKSQYKWINEYIHNEKVKEQDKNL